ncbi:MAG: NADH-quinone oxidoreductase subunit J [Bdellovibrionaceae bacterium]|nr:NADH-quinone oxidoreductase subunit J [Pseudobdellovibrionaceae bacterium]
MITDVLMFWFLALVVLGSGLAVILFTNPVYSALSLVMAMVGVAAVFVTLGAYFIAGVQLIVYAGAVMVLFVMVLMLFDLKRETHSFAAGKISGALKLISVGLFAGLVVGGIVMSQGYFVKENEKSLGAASATQSVNTVAGSQTNLNVVNTDNTKVLGTVLFSKHVFGFEALGVLLTVIAVGTVALARSKGGTHAKH